MQFNNRVIITGYELWKVHLDLFCGIPWVGENLFMDAAF